MEVIQRKTCGKTNQVPLQNPEYKGKGKGPVLDIALLHYEHMLGSSLQSRKWQLIGMSSTLGLHPVARKLLLISRPAKGGRLS